ncbi:MAG TPA: glycosyltransferase [Streptosporangiaceae bacterium]|nr:glycosyltransferase [Streptosporangiaceae bacterium]
MNADAPTLPNEDWRELREQPYLGPNTGEVLDATAVLEELAARQSAVTATREFPPYDGPYTGEQERLAPGDQLRALGEPERAELDRAAAVMAPGRGRHSAPPSTPAGVVLARHGARFTAFSAIGALVLVAGIAVQALLVAAHAGRYGSYAGQAVFSIEASFALNWRVTWRDRRSPFWPAAWRFNVQKLALTAPNFALYALLLRVGLGWLAANLAVTAVFLAANYVTGDLWTFTATRVARKSRDGGVLRPVVPLPPRWQPSVSAVIPCKGNEATILATVESLLAQDYPGLLEVILVGDVGDSTWAALDGVRDRRLRLVEQEKTPGRRDPNVKRDKGVRAAHGEVIALADSDIVMDPGWLTRAVGLLREQGGGLVGGGMRAIRPHKFWPRFVDNNILAAKTSRIPGPYAVTAANFGHRGRKPPVTANAVVTRAAYEACPLDVAWAYGYEDYEWMHRLAEDGCPITMHPGLTGDHHHREKFAHLVREYRRSAHGCAQFVRRHPGSALAGKRRAQAFGLPVAALAAVIAAAAAAAEGHALAVLALAVGALAVLSGREAVRSRSLEAAAYPAAALALGGVFAWTLTTTLLMPTERDAPVWDSAGPRAPARGLGRAGLLALAAVFAAGAVLRLWSLASRPGWQYDEGVYTQVATGLLRHGQLAEHATYGTAVTTDLFQPPFYFLALARWFAAAGPSVYHARLLGAACSLASLGLLYLLVRRVHGPRTALFAIVPVMLDGWLLYIQRVSYLENALLALITGGMLLYQAALDRPSWQRFAAAGSVLGFAAAFKYTGTYVLVAVALCWLIRRGDRRGHLVLLGCAAAAFAGCILIEARMFGGHLWWQDTIVQVRRVLGVQQSGGTLTSPAKALHLLFGEYWMFAASLAVACAGVVTALRRVRSAWRARNLASLRGNALLLSWMTAGVVVFGASSLRFPQYFALILIPAYAYFWTEAHRRQVRPRYRAVIAAAAVAAGLLSFGARVAAHDDNVFAGVQQYAAASIPPGAVVIADEAVGDLIGQPYCREQVSGPCEGEASWAITWDTYLQTTQSLGDVPFRRVFAGAVPVRSWTGFNGTVTVWRLRR